jgi:hypothetical protein
MATIWAFSAQDPRPKDFDAAFHDKLKRALPPVVAFERGFFATAGAILTVRKLFPRLHTIRMGLDFFFHKHNPSCVVCGGGAP